jgi:hypothetical protein
MRDKRKLTEELIALLAEEDRVDLKFAMSAWWFNLRRNGGMRLTSVGYSTLADILDLELGKKKKKQQRVNAMGEVIPTKESSLRKPASNRSALSHTDPVNKKIIFNFKAVKI